MCFEKLAFTDQLWLHKILRPLLRFQAPIKKLLTAQECDNSICYNAGVLSLSKAADSPLCPPCRLNADKAAVPVAAPQSGQPDLGSCMAALQEASRHLDHLLLQHQLAMMSLGSLTSRSDKHPPQAAIMLHQCFSFKEPTRIAEEGLADALDIIAGKSLTEVLHS